MRHPVTIPLVVALIAGAAVPAASQAPDRQPATIPTELAVALVSSDLDPFEHGVPLFVVGRAPQSFPAALVPPAPARVVGGMWAGTSGSIIVAYPRSDSSAMSRARQALRAAGWSPPPPIESSGFASTMSFDEARPLCRRGETAMLRAAHVAGGGVRITWIGDDEHTHCSRRSLEQPDPFRRDLELPLLLPPPNAETRGHGTSSGGSGFDAHARLDTSLPAAELVAHYGRQLEAAGWKGGAPAAALDAAVRAFTATDTKGRPWRGALLAVEVGPQARHVSLRMSQVEER